MSSLVKALVNHYQNSDVFVPATPNDGCLPQLLVLQLLPKTLIIPSGACSAQYSVIFVPVTPRFGHLQQPWVVHSLLWTSTIPSGVYCVQPSKVFLRSIPEITNLPKSLALHFVLLDELTIFLDVLPAPLSRSLMAPAAS